MDTNQSTTLSTKYQMLDGKIFNATSNINLIEQMRADSLNPGTNLKDYMGLVSQSSYEYNHSNIRTNTHENFIKDLIGGGLIQIIT